MKWKLLLFGVGVEFTYGGPSYMKKSMDNNMERTI